MGGAYSTYGGEQKCRQGFNGKIMLTWMLNRMAGHAVDSSGSETDMQWHLLKKVINSQIT
jgi:hypothetical protein